jgi:hypothetical protein
MVADVLTDPNSEKVVEEGVGRLNLLLVVYRLPDGRLILGGGPVLSYYEFKQPMAERLTDEVWKDWLRQGRVPRRPAWTRRFVVE